MDFSLSARRLGISAAAGIVLTNTSTSLGRLMLNILLSFAQFERELIGERIVRSRKTIYVRFDLNDYSIPPEAVGRQLILVASDITVRILDGSFEVARHARTYDRHQLVLDPVHQEAVLKIKRKAFHSTPGGRLEQAVPESKTLLDLAFAQGESAGAQTAQLMKLLEQYGAAALRRGIVEALQRNAPRAS
jgi:hypothetical protein